MAPTSAAQATLATARRPQTKDASDFWYMPTNRWDDLLKVARGSDKVKQRAALQTIRRYSAAGRVMETAEGKPAPRPCNWCTSSGLEHLCRVWADDRKKELMCARCKRNSRQSCRAGRVVDAIEADVTTPSQAEGNSLVSVADLQGQNGNLKRQVEVVQQTTERQKRPRPNCKQVISLCSDDEDDNKETSAPSVKAEPDTETQTSTTTSSSAAPSKSHTKKLAQLRIRQQKLDLEKRKIELEEQQLALDQERMEIED